jgi:hypothetical protein
MPSTGLDEVAGPRELADGWSPRTDVAVVPDDRATSVFGLPETVMARIDPTSGIDIARAVAAAAAGTFAECKQNARASVLPTGSSREDLWQRALLPIARVSRSMTVVDRYIFKNLAQLTARGKEQDGFLVWLMGKLDAAALEGCELKVIGYDQRPSGDPVDADAAAELVRNAWTAAGGRLGAIRVVAAQPASYLPHDRHISSSIGVGITFPESFDAFDQATIATDEGVEYSYRSDPMAVEKLQTAERRFEDDRSAKLVLACERA